MNTKEQVLALLLQAEGESVSGEQTARAIGVSRNAIWKAVAQLRQDGYDIASSTNKGYRLAHAGDVFTAGSIKKYLRGKAAGCDIECYKTLSSTNTLLKQKAEAGEKEGKVAIAETQSGGKGRLGRSFFSPMGTGIYMSILLRPQLEMENAVLITTLAAVCVAQAVENVTDKQTGIKWVNDIYYNGKKICGILTEAGCDCENGRLNYAVLGIGINVIRPANGFSEELDDIATCLYDGETPGIRARLAAEVLNLFFEKYGDIAKKDFLDDYRRRMTLTGKTVNFTRGGEEFSARVLSVDDDARLVVHMEDGRACALSRGEVRF
jgi:BirA family biotin operon repressor/biotin-[acetyl-CoA-carboxylase] ligase